MANYHHPPVTQQEACEIRSLVRQQIREIGLDPHVTCPCGQEVRAVFACRCFYCGVHFCRKCAARHFEEQK